MDHAIRFHLDEHIPASVADGLRRRGIDVTTSAESGLLGASDATQLSFAASAERILVTHDADFLRLHGEGVVHTGIAYCQQGSLRIGEILRRLILIYDRSSAEEMARKILFL
jgi:predicted nuclease of predicted toxin-antitoxin system